jgi:RecB family exonuclease
MSAKLHLLSPDQCIVEELAQNFQNQSIETLRRTLLVVPTQRLGTALLVRLLEKKSALIPPEILTLEALIRSAGTGDGEAFSIAHDATVDLILRQRLEEHPYKHLKLGHERELRLLYGELYDHLLRHDGIDRLKATIADDIYKNEAHLGSLYDRAEEISAIMNFLDERLIELELLPRSQYLAKASAELARNWQEITAKYEQIVLIGFTSMATSWQSLLPTVTGDDRAHFWLSEAPRLYHNTSPLKELLKKIESLNPEIIAGHAKPIQKKSFQCFVAQNIRDEVLWTRRIVEKAISQGFAPARIGILVTDENLYGTAIRTIFQDKGIDCNIALPESWGGTLAGRHLYSLLQFWKEKQNLASLLAWMDHPLSKAQWEENKLASLRRAIMQTGVPAILDYMRNEIKDDLIDDFDELAGSLQALRIDQTLSLNAWLEQLEAYINRFNYWESFPSRDLLQSSQEVYEDFVGSMRAFGAVQPLMTGQTFWDLVESHLLKGSVRGTGEPLAGIQILSLAEARYFPFELAIIVGCHEGCFPKALPQDELLDNYLKKMLGLPGWEVLEAMEDQTFHLLKSRLPHLIMLRSSRLGEEILVRSRFTEALIARERSEEIALGNPLHFEKSTDTALEAEGQIENWLDISTARMSASRLDKLLHCPYSFLLETLGIHSEASKTEESDSRREGEWLHAVLQAFVTGKGPKGKILDPWETDDEPELFERALERINFITDRMVPYDLKESALVHHLKNHSWPRYLQHLLKQTRSRKSVREHAFGQTHSPVTIELRGKSRELHGRIDALDFSSQWAFVTDFKRRTIPSLDKSKKGLNAQLPLYAIALRQKSPVKPLPPLVLGYWNIYQGVWTAHGVDDEHRQLLATEGLCTKTTPSTEQMTDELMKTWRWREEDILAKTRFYADPGQCQLCDFAGLCRKNDPRAIERVAAQNSLELRLEGGAPDA